MNNLRAGVTESVENLSWLRPGVHYRCQKSVGGLKEKRVYRFEAFSSDPLGDTRQYLFHDEETEDFHGVELSADMPTPRWREHLSEAGS